MPGTYSYLLLFLQKSSIIGTWFFFDFSFLNDEIWCLEEIKTGGTEHNQEEKLTLNSQFLLKAYSVNYLSGPT